MIRYKRVTVNGTANSRTTAELLAGTQTEPKRLIALWFMEVTSTLQNDAVIEGFIEQLQVLEHDVRCFLNNAGTPLIVTKPRIELNVELSAGKAFDVGQTSGGTASDFVYVAEYEVDTSIRGGR